MNKGSANQEIKAFTKAENTFQKMGKWRFWVSCEENVEGLYQMLKLLAFQTSYGSVKDTKCYRHLKTLQSGKPAVHALLVANCLLRNVMQS